MVAFSPSYGSRETTSIFVFGSYFNCSWVRNKVLTISSMPRFHQLTLEVGDFGVMYNGRYSLNPFWREWFLAGNWQSGFCLTFISFNTVNLWLVFATQGSIAIVSQLKTSTSSSDDAPGMAFSPFNIFFCLLECLAPLISHERVHAS